ncbi:MAG TPA: gluconate 2-dehydrogenase subunit 3 family protein, partial [Actinomycetota bacterium]|nr:gluconate 2-dehydrogenase subunit 3 family protein [Actinomycetota bacterium]
MTRPSPALAALADAVLPPGGVLPSAGDVGVPARADALLATLPPALRRAARAELGLLQWLGLASGRPFSALPRERRLALLERLRRLPPPLSEAVTALLLVPLLAYASAPEVLRALGGDPGPLVPLTAALPPPGRLPVRSFPDLRPDLDEGFDAVIVGSGAGGAPVARVLARAGWSVAVV